MLPVVTRQTSGVARGGVERGGPPRAAIKRGPQKWSDKGSSGILRLLGRQNCS